MKRPSRDLSSAGLLMAALGAATIAGVSGHQLLSGNNDDPVPERARSQRFRDSLDTADFVAAATVFAYGIWETAAPRVTAVLHVLLLVALFATLAVPVLRRGARAFERRRVRPIDELSRAGEVAPRRSSVH
jgi:hypothetical protein